MTTYTASGTSSPITVSGLPVGNYTFTVDAANSLGTGPESATSQSITISTGGGGIGGNAPPGGTSLTVDFRSTTQTLDKWSIGSTVSCYSGSGSANMNRSGSWLAKLGALGPMSWRIPLRYNGGNPGSSAGGAQSSGDAVTYINNIRSIGGTPLPIIGGDNSDNSESANDVAGIVHYFNDNNGSRAGGKFERIIIGNEADNGSGGNAYLSALPSLAAAAKGADSSILVDAPGASFWDPSFIQSCAIANVDILSYHAYDGGNTDGTGFPNTDNYYNHLVTMKGYGRSIVGCEEMNWNYEGGDQQFFTWQNLCFVASAAGQVFKAGGHMNHYADSNGPLGLLNDGTGQNQNGNFGDPLPAYYGLGMWTGMNGTFRRFGTSLCPSSSTVTNVDCFATTNGKVILINKDSGTTHAVTIGFGGKTSGVYSAWQTSQNSPTAAPTKVINASSYSGSIISLSLPAGTVTSLELD